MWTRLIPSSQDIDSQKDIIIERHFSRTICCRSNWDQKPTPCCLSLVKMLDIFDATMHGTPDPSDVFVLRHDILASDQFILLATVSDQELGLFQNLLLFQVPHAHGLFAAVDVVRFQDRMLVRPRRHAELGAGIFRGELCEQRRCQK